MTVIQEGYVPVTPEGEVLGKLFGFKKTLLENAVSMRFGKEFSELALEGYRVLPVLLVKAPVQTCDAFYVLTQDGDVIPCSCKTTADDSIESFLDKTGRQVSWEVYRGSGFSCEPVKFEFHRGTQIRGGRS